MMAALEAGGLPLITDHERPPDRHNPRGYFEDSRVLELRQRGGDWLRERSGQGVKVLSHLLPHLPSGVPWKVIVMRRPLREVVASQNAMLGRAGSDTGSDTETLTLLGRSLEQALSWLEQQPEASVLEVWFPRLLSAPAEEFARVQVFLSDLVALDVAAMAAVVDPRLPKSCL